MHDLCDELGDLLLQVVFHARMAEEAGDFAFGDVVEAVTRKMIRRHPHVFARSDADTPEAVKLQWDEIKKAEKAERQARRSKRGQDAEEILAEITPDEIEGAGSGPSRKARLWRMVRRIALRRSQESGKAS